MAVPTECGKTIKALLLCKERFQEAECQHGSVSSLYIHCLSVSSSVSSSLTPESECPSLFLSPMWAVGATWEGKRERGTQIILDPQNPEDLQTN